MKYRINYPSSVKIKIALIIIAVFLAGALLLYTQWIVNKLEEKEREVADLYARSLEFIATGDSEEGDFSFIFEEIIKAIDFPLILTDSNRNPISPYDNNIKNLNLDMTLSPDAQRNYLHRQIDRMDQRRPPIKITYEDTIVLNYLYYGDSPLIQQLRWFPYIEIALGALFIMSGYIGFSYIKRNEQSNIWAGMARETAHQIGTPLSSIIGWIELLEEETKMSEKGREYLPDLKKDVDRLSKITARFSKIGSRPDLKEQPLTDIVNNVINYFNRRLPQMNKQINISLDSKDNPIVAVNPELFEWVLENLIKNSIDAIEQGKGKIQITIGQGKSYVYIDITDTGKGIEKKYRKDIFRPGFSTKQRGWGLGLSLSKRIVEEYHHGKLTVKESKVGEGTTFRIQVKSNAKRAV